MVCMAEQLVSTVAASVSRHFGFFSQFIFGSMATLSCHWCVWVNGCLSHLSLVDLTCHVFEVYPTYWPVTTGDSQAAAPHDPKQDEAGTGNGWMIERSRFKSLNLNIKCGWGNWTTHTWFHSYLPHSGRLSPNCPAAACLAALCFACAHIGENKFPQCEIMKVKIN